MAILKFRSGFEANVKNKFTMHKQAYFDVNADAPTTNMLVYIKENFMVGFTLALVVWKMSVVVWRKPLGVIC